MLLGHVIFLLKILQLLPKVLEDKKGANPGSVFFLSKSPCALSGFTILASIHLHASIFFLPHRAFPLLFPLPAMFFHSFLGWSLSSYKYQLKCCLLQEVYPAYPCFTFYHKTLLMFFRPLIRL